MATPPRNDLGRGSTTPPQPDGRLSSSARGKTQRSRRLHRWIGLSPWPRHVSITLKVTYKGGNECWYLVEARGRHGMVPGVACLHDVVREVQQRSTTG